MAPDGGTHMWYGIAVNLGWYWMAVHIGWKCMAVHLGVVRDGGTHRLGGDAEHERVRSSVACRGWV